MDRGGRAVGAGSAVDRAGTALYNTPTGALVVLGGLGASVLGYRIMIFVGRMPEPKRWFA